MIHVRVAVAVGDPSTECEWQLVVAVTNPSAECEWQWVIQVAKCGECRASQANSKLLIGVVCDKLCWTCQEMSF